MEKYKVLHVAVIIYSMIMAIIISLITFSLNKYYMIGFLPLSFSILLMLFPRFTILATRHIGLGFLYFVMMIRYSIMPLILVIVERMEHSSIGYKSEYLNSAIILMIYELTACVITIVLLGNKLLLNGKVKNEPKVLNKKSTNVVYIIIIAISALLIALFPALLGNFQFFSIDDAKLGAISYFRGLDIRLLIISKMVLYLLLVKYFASKYENNKNIIYYILSLLVSFLFVGIFQGENRTNILVDIICVILVLWYCFYSKRKITIVLISFFGLGMLTAISIFRLFAPRSWRPDGGDTDISLNFLANNLQLYVSGPENVALGVQSVELFNSNINFETLINDLFLWTGYLGNMLSLDETNSTVYFFNYLFNGVDPTGSVSLTQIIPLIIQGYSYFGFVGAPIFSILMCVFVILLDKLIYKTSSIDFVFIYTFMVVRLGLFLGLNITILLMFVFDKYIQLWLAVKMNRIIRISFKKR
ncbi:O-antigen polymerase [Peribacillus sp. SCS-155]|uniref:O-antigen polymerase n=1 Tax=Peribacillus sedimenti TaxID=3115297 RepID=UPI0039062003